MATARTVSRKVVPLVLAFLLVLAIGAFTPAAARQWWEDPKITSVSPTHGPVGTSITIKGEHFENAVGTIRFWSGAFAQVDSWSDTMVKATVPKEAWSSNFTLMAADGESCSGGFIVDITIDNITPNHATPGKVVTVNGGGFGPTREFGDWLYLQDKRKTEIQPVREYVSWKSSRIQFKVPNWDPWTYSAYVHKGSLSEERESNRVPFTIDSTGPPVLESASPNPCPSGGRVTITGKNFGDVKSDDFNINLWNPADGKKYDTNLFLFTPSGTVKTNKLPLFDGKFKICVTKGIASLRPVIGGSAVNSNTLDITFDKNLPLPPEDIVKPTSRVWGHDSVGAGSPARNWYLAEGSTGNDEETWVLVQNPNDRPAKVTLTYITSSKTKKMPADTIPANSRRSYDVRKAIPGTLGISTKVEADRSVIAERSVYGSHRQWGHDSIGVSEPATTWYLAEGSTANGVVTKISVMNPNNTSADVKLTYMTPDGKKDGPSETLKANSRKYYDVSKTVRSAWSVSTKVESTNGVGIVAERAMYAGTRFWAHDSAGVTSPAATWYLAEGCTSPDFETWVLVQNPNNKRAKVTLTFMTPSGAVAGPTKTLEPNSRESFEVAKTVKAWEVSTKVTSNQPVVAERSMYARSKAWAHDSVGVTGPGKTWYLAEGCTLPNTETWVLVQNPNPTAAKINLTYMMPDGTATSSPITIPANSRKSFNIADTVNLCADVSTLVESDRNVVVERAMYGDPK